MTAYGTWVTMVTPFQEDGRINFDAIPAMVDYYAAGCDGIFAVCQSSEMFYLSLEERVALAKAVVSAAGARIPVVVSGHISDSAEAQKEEIRRMADAGAQAVVLVSNRMAGAEESDDVWMERTQDLMRAVPGARLGIYECPFPYKRLLSERSLRFLAESGRFDFFKDTCCEVPRMRERLRLLGGAPALLNANSATLLASLQMGCAGFSGVMANFHPELYKWLTAHFAKAPEQAQRLQDALTFLSWVENLGYPACAKLHMQRIGLPVGTYCRSGAHKLLPPDIQEVMDSMIREEERLRVALGVPAQHPPRGRVPLD